MYRSQSPSSKADRVLPGSQAEAIRCRHSLFFPAQSRARLDVSLDEVVVAARRVMLTQTRLRELIEANRSVAHYRDLSTLLNGIVNSAVALVAAGSGVFEVTATREHPLRLVRCGTPSDRPTETYTRELRLHRDDEVFGVIYVGRNGQHDFTPEDEQLLRSFGDMASIAIANARFREKVEVFESA
jgi:nitrate/nitrite-specific signal transduction histidine kinase